MALAPIELDLRMSSKHVLRLSLTLEVEQICAIEIFISFSLSSLICQFPLHYARVDNNAR